MSVFESFIEFDDKLAQLGEPPLSAWWREQLGAWFAAYERGDASEFWACVGRGGAKSTAVCKVGTFLALFGDFVVPAAQRHYATILSARRDEAAKSVGIVDAWLTALKVPHRTAGEVIELTKMNRGIRILTANVAAASGWRSFFVGADEFAKWAREGDRNLDADEVLASARAMTITHSRAALFVASTPWADEGSFRDVITAGSTVERHVAHAPSWIANPDLISEAASRKRERDDRTWRREYAAQFVAAFESNFYPIDAISRAVDPGRRPNEGAPTDGGGWRYVVAIDPGFYSDAFAICVAHSEPSARGPIVVVDFIDEMRAGSSSTYLSPDLAVQRVADLRRAYQPGGMMVHSDQSSAATLSAMFLAHGVALVVDPWSAASLVAKHSTVRTLMLDGRLRLPQHGALQHQIARVGSKLLPSGIETISAQGGHIGDSASACVAAVAAAHELAPENFNTRAIVHSRIATGAFTPFGGKFGDVGDVMSAQSQPRGARYETRHEMPASVRERTAPRPTTSAPHADEIAAQVRQLGFDPYTK
jgi:hypothetical protein